MIDRLRKGTLESHYISLPTPEDHTDDYDQILLMLEMEINETVTIDYRTFRQYVMDEWDWKASFNTTNTFYAAQA